MSTGISISSINRIKELAEEKKFAEALEILDTQNLDKSINPQFLRISGEIFRENKRYYDSRKILLRAHQMSPQGLRIIAELIQLYLELGYFAKAQRYYDQYLFYTTPEDTQKDYVEYIMKKGMGVDTKELASILIPILERLPDDKWNFEAVLLYDKMDRKDKALDECRYILENFKESIYVKPAIDYIEDKLDVDAYFYVYPRHEIEEDRELFGGLIEEEEKLLEDDHLRMYPPEAKIVVEAEDKEMIDIKPAKEKKTKKKKKSKSVKSVDSEMQGEETSPNNSEQLDDNPNIANPEVSTGTEDSEEQIKQEREAALDKLLSKKISAEQIKESAKQAAKAVKQIDANKAKKQVESVAKTVKGNVKKATDVLGEAVGVKASEEENAVDNIQENDIVDGIIESVLEPPKKVVGQVVTNEELDALIPESLEAMSTTEIIDLEEKKAEAERLELEALEAQLKLEEEKKSKNRIKKSAVKMDSDIVQNVKETDSKMVSVSGEEFTQLKERFLASVTDEEEMEEKPLDSLGFISVVQSDVDAKMEEEIPDAAGILHQMIDNKEFYTGEDSTKFESKASYENHGFEVEDYSFETFEKEEEDKPTHAQLYDNSVETDEDIPTVEIIYAQENVIDFSEMIPEDISVAKEQEVIQKEYIEDSDCETSDEAVSNDRDEQENLSNHIAKQEDKKAASDSNDMTDIIIEKENDWEEGVVESENEWASPVDIKETEEFVAVTIEQKTAEIEEHLDAELETEDQSGAELEVEEQSDAELEVKDQSDTVLEIEDKNEQLEEDMEAMASDRRNKLRVKILITDSMVKKLMDLKESR